MPKLSTTEAINKNSADLDRLPISKMIAVMHKENLAAAECVAKAAKQIEQAVKIVTKAIQAGCHILFTGAGTSGRLGVLEAVECPPTFSVPYGLFKGIVAGGRKAVFKSVENAEDDPAQGAKDFLKAAKAGDVLIGIAASGNTPYVQGALKEARSKGHTTILVACNKNADKSNADIFICLDTGAEVVSGSTRLKAGTATKLALNMITTLSMVSCGRVYKNYMVAVKATNAKLKKRAIRLISTITGISEAAAQKLAVETKYDVKTSVVMAKLKTDIKQARALLKKHKGYLNKIIENDK